MPALDFQNADCRLTLADYNSPESKEIYETIRWRDVPPVALRSVVVPRVIARCLRMRKRWPWADYESYLEKPLDEIRREFGIRVVA